MRPSFYRPFGTRLLASLMASAVLTGTLAATCPLISNAKKAAPVAKTEQKQTSEKEKSSKVSAQAVHKAPKPVLDESARKAIDEAAQTLDPETRNSLNRLADALHTEDRAVYNELRDEEELSMADIGMLWEAAVERSGTIRYAIEKLSRRDATGKPVADDNFSKRMLSSLAHVTGAATAMWTGTPAGLIGSNMVDQLMSGNPQDSVLSRVTDTDMVLLAKEIESLQSQIIQLYYNYRHAKERYTQAQEASSTVTKYFDHASASQDSTAETLQPLLQSMYDSVKQDEQNALQAYNSSRSALNLVVGPEAIAALDQPPSARNTKQAATAPSSS